MMYNIYIYLNDSATITGRGKLYVFKYIPVYLLSMLFPLYLIRSLLIGNIVSKIGLEHKCNWKIYLIISMYDTHNT